MGLKITQRECREVIMKTLKELRLNDNIFYLENNDICGILLIQLNRKFSSSPSIKRDNTQVDDCIKRNMINTIIELCTAQCGSSREKNN